MKTIHKEKVSLQQCLSTCSLRRLNTVKFFRAFSPLAPRLSNGKQQQVFSESCLHIKAFVATQRDSRFVFFSILFSIFGLMTGSITRRGMPSAWRDSRCGKAAARLRAN